MTLTVLIVLSVAGLFNPPLKCTLHRQFIMYELLLFLLIRIIEYRLFQWSHIRVICHTYVSPVKYIIVHAARFAPQIA